MASEDTLIRDPEGGGNQSGLRDQNARLVLSYIRRHGALPSAEIARRSGLSAQTVSNIIRSLEAEGLIQRGEAIKGKVGKPSIPMALNPRGAFSLGLNIGRRSAELVLVDFNGNQLDQRTTVYRYPTPNDVFAFMSRGIDEIGRSNPGTRDLITGIGVARPNEIWNWLEIVNAPETAMRDWQDLDLAHRVNTLTGLEVSVENDATAACVAEHLVGRGSEFSDFAYIFMGAFVGGGLVLNDKVYAGANGYGAALGPLPVPDTRSGTTPLLNVASLFVLEDALRETGTDPQVLRQSPGNWAAHEACLGPWIDQTARNLAIAAGSIAAIVEVEAVLIDGAMPASVRRRLVSGVRQALSHLDLTGIEPPAIEEAAVGRAARSVGAALLPIHSRYFIT